MMGSTMMGGPSWDSLLWLVVTVVLLLAALCAAVWLTDAVAGPRTRAGRISAPAATPMPRPDSLLVTSPGAPSELRAADVDREHVAQMLSVHLSSGRLTMPEYEDRVAAVYAARTLGQLRAQLEGLPVAAR